MSPSADVETLASAPLEIVGRIFGASNATLQCVTGNGQRVVYKPQRGERPLWDFPDGTITGREIASYLIDQDLGTNLVPPTIWREDAPAGPGMCQAWVDEEESARLVDVVAPDHVPEGWIAVLRAYDEAGDPVVLVHANDARLQQLALLDAVINNGDRKGGHVITDVEGAVWAVDHGVTLTVEPKLRTVLWGWAGEPIPEPLLGDLQRLLEHLETGELDLTRWLDPAELHALLERTRRLRIEGVFPLPSDDWPAIPWPVF